MDQYVNARFVLLCRERSKESWAGVSCRKCCVPPNYHAWHCFSGIPFHVRQLSEQFLSKTPRKKQRVRRRATTVCRLSLLVDFNTQRKRELGCHSTYRLTERASS